MRKAGDAEIDTAEQSAIKLLSQQQTSSAIVVTDHRPANGSAQAPNLVRIPSQNIPEGSNVADQVTSRENGDAIKVESEVENIVESNSGGAKK